jgi:hypothetical protein
MYKSLSLPILVTAIVLTGCTKLPVAVSQAPAQVRVQANSAAMKAVEAAIIASFNRYTELLNQWNATNDEDKRLKIDGQMIAALDEALTKVQAAVKGVPETKARTLDELATRTRVAYRPLKTKLDNATDFNTKRETIQNIYNVLIPALQQSLQTAQSI